MNQPELDLHPLTCGCPCGCERAVDNPGLCWPCWSETRDDGIEGHIRRRRQEAARLQEEQMGEAHFHIRRPTGLADVRQSVDATTSRARVEQVIGIYRGVSEAHAAQLEVQEDCTCNALEQVTCPACEFVGKTARPDCPVCRGTGSVARIHAQEWEAVVESLTSTRR